MLVECVARDDDMHAEGVPLPFGPQGYAFVFPVCGLLVYATHYGSALPEYLPLHFTLESCHLLCTV